MVETCYIPQSLDEALKLRKEKQCHPLAGGTDLMVQYRKGTDVTPAFPFCVMIISNLKELKGIRVLEDGSVRIGAGVTASEIAESELVPWHVRQAAGRMGAVSLRNIATIGGNLGNASPKGDLPQPLILLDAWILLAREDGLRKMKVDEFILGSKKTALRDDEIIYAVEIPKVDYTYAYYHKVGTRRANAISKLSLSALMSVKDGIITDFRASTGAAGPKVVRDYASEALIRGRRIDAIAEVKEQFLEGWNGAISPHAMPLYRRAATRNMLSYFLDECAKAPEGKIIEDEVN